MFLVLCKKLLFFLLRGEQGYPGTAAAHRAPQAGSPGAQHERDGEDEDAAREDEAGGVLGGGVASLSVVRVGLRKLMIAI